MNSKKLMVLVSLAIALSLTGLLAHAEMKGGMKGHSMGKQVFSGEAFGVQVKGNMMDIKAQMAGMGKGMKVPEGITHHLMVKPEGALPEGTSAKAMITFPGGDQKEVALAKMEKHIGADLNLDKKGLYKIKCLVVHGGDEAGFDFDYEVK